MRIFWIILVLLVFVPVQADMRGDYAIEAEISHHQLYLGETARYTVRYYAYNLDRIPTIEPVIFPNFEDLWVGDVVEKSPQAITIDHVQYYVGEVTFEVIPLVAGTLTIPPSRLILLETAYSPMMSELSNTITLDVQPLPPDMPSHFMGGVGEYRVHFALDQLTASVGDHLKLTAEVISYMGNLDYLTPPAIVLGEEWHVVQGMIYPTVRNEFNPVLKVRAFEWILIPLEAGLLTVDGLIMSYFDPVLGQYIELSQAPIQVNVTGQTALNLHPAIREQVALMMLSDGDRFIYPNRLLWMIPAGIMGLIGLFRIYQPYQARRNTQKKRREALGKALQRIDDLSNHPYKQVNRRTRSIIKLYLSDKGQKTLDESVNSQFQALFLLAEEMAYQPNLGEQEQAGLIDQLKTRLTRIDEGWER